MSDKEARALGVGSSLVIGDTEFHLTPISIGSLAEIQREALRAYKRQYLQTYADMQDSLPAGKLEEVVDKVATWDVDKLPTKVAYSCGHLQTNDEVSELLVSFYGPSILPLKDKTALALLSNLLDEEKITTEQVEKLTGGKPLSAHIPYDLWWATASYDGRILLLWASLQEHHPKYPKDQIKKWDPAKIIEGSRLVESMTQPQMGNT